MDTKDKWSIKIGGGYGKNQTKIQPAEILIEILNFKDTSERKIADFCTKHKIVIFPQNEKGLTDIFKEEQTKLKSTAKKLLNKDFDESVIKEINEYLGHIKNQVALVTPKEMNKLNYSSDLIKDSDSSQYLIRTKVPTDSFAMFWDQLVRRTIEEQNLGTCRNCGDFFIKIKRNTKGFCCDDCRQLYSKKKRYHEKNTSKKSPR